VFQNTEETTQLVRERRKNERKLANTLVLHCYSEGKRSRERQTKTWMDNIKEDLKTKKVIIKTASDLIRDRARWRIFVQTDRQPS